MTVAQVYEHIKNQWSIYFKMEKLYNMWIISQKALKKKKKRSVKCWISRFPGKLGRVKGTRGGGGVLGGPCNIALTPTRRCGLSKLAPPISPLSQVNNQGSTFSATKLSNYLKLSGKKKKVPGSLPRLRPSPLILQAFIWKRKKRRFSFKTKAENSLF